MDADNAGGKSVGETFVPQCWNINRLMAKMAI